MVETFMIVRQLETQDYDQVERIYHLSLESSDRIKIKKNIPMPDSKLREEMTARWLSAIKKMYLNSQDLDHILFGVFDGDRLLSYVGIRLDLPIDYQDGWIVSWLKGDPSTDQILNGALRMLWIYMFNYCEKLGKIKWHTIVDKERHSAFDAFGRRAVPEINDRYHFYTLCDIPSNTRPELEWAWAMMGRQLQSTDMIVRTGVLKSHVVDS
jgi:hypothetical protein